MIDRVASHATAHIYSLYSLHPKICMPSRGIFPPTLAVNETSSLSCVGAGKKKKLRNGDVCFAVAEYGLI